MSIQNQYPQALMDQIRKSPNFELVTCEGKARFDTLALAKRIATRRKHKADRPGTPYHCKCCGGWHIGGGKGR